MQLLRVTTVEEFSRDQFDTSDALHHNHTQNCTLIKCQYTNLGIQFPIKTFIINQFNRLPSQPLLNSQLSLDFIIDQQQLKQISKDFSQAYMYPLQPL